MNSQKADNDLNLALDAREEERERSLNLNVGYEPGTDCFGCLAGNGIIQRICNFKSTGVAGGDTGGSS